MARHGQKRNSGVLDLSGDDVSLGSLTQPRWMGTDVRVLRYHGRDTTFEKSRKPATQLHRTGSHIKHTSTLDESPGRPKESCGGSLVEHAVERQCDARTVERDPGPPPPGLRGLANNVTALKIVVGEVFPEDIIMKENDLLFAVQYEMDLTPEHTMGRSKGRVRESKRCSGACRPCARKRRGAASVPSAPLTRPRWPFERS